MSTHKQIDRICVAAVLLSLVLTLLFLNGKALGLTPASKEMGYESRLFDTSRVHTIDIVMDGWDAFLDTCESEEYSPCSVVIDNEGFQNVGLRAKGNTSLNTVSSLGSDRYSFKLEFDRYDSGKTCHGLDKLCLNNLIQDNTMMKDYLVYQMMAQFGGAAPLCSFTYITVNGEDWGLYLAVEGMEESFLRRNYGSQYGQLYKPDSMSFGGGRGNGRDFNMEDFDLGDLTERNNFTPPGMAEGGDRQGLRGGPNSFPSGMPEGMPQGGGFQPPDMPGGKGQGFGGPGGGMGSNDVKLQYIDDDPDSYSNIFDSAKTDVSEADRQRLIQALKALSQGDAASALDVDAVLRYFVVHNFVVNGDSYTGSMVHNYYLYEEDGALSMLPWDYNLAFGTFQGNNASSAVNDSIDTPLSVTGGGDRPMADWISSSQEYTALYHQYFGEFLETVDPAAIIDHAYALIAPYVERDPTKFCTYEEFETGVQTLKTFCALRAESVSGQLAGSDSLVDASGLSLSDMGTMNQGGGPGGGGQGGFERPGRGDSPQNEGGDVPVFGQLPDGFPQGGGRPDGMGFPGGENPAQAGTPGGTSNSGSWTLLAASALVLLLGLLAAFRYKRFGRYRQHT